jgi:hypothetical protein
MIESKIDKAHQLGLWLGRKQAFAALAGRCSAADAECLRQIREQRQYRALGLNWSEFCKQRVGLTHVSVDKLIRRLEEFGPQYFILAQATGIGPNEYRRIRGAVRGNALLCAGEEIPIDAENAPRLGAAVEKLRRGPGAEGSAAGHASHAAGHNAGSDGAPSAAEAKAQAEIERAFERAARGVKLAREQFQRLVDMRLEGHGRMELMARLGQAAGQFRELEQASWK